MRNRSTVAVFVCSVIGNLLYLWGVYRWAVCNSKDVDILFNSAVMAVAIGLLIFYAETSAITMNRKRIWGLCGLLGPVGWGLLLLSIRPNGKIVDTFPVKETPASMSKAGWVICVIIGLCWLSAVLGLVTDISMGSKRAGKRHIYNERIGFLNLLKIADAQATYRQTDWDGDGRKTFAQFLPHLWKTVDGRAVSIKTGLLPKALSFAENEKDSVKGYYYINSLTCDNNTLPVRSDHLSSTPSTPGHNDECFSIVALPSVCGETGKLAFRTDQTDRVFAQVVTTANIPSEILNQVSSTGWVELSGINELKTLQKKITNEQ